MAIESEVHVSCLPKSIFSQMNPVNPSIPISIRAILLSSHLHLGLHIDFLPTGFRKKKI